jgi:hypothetical protein
VTGFEGKGEDVSVLCQHVRGTVIQFFQLGEQMEMLIGSGHAVGLAVKM